MNRVSIMGELAASLGHEISQPIAAAAISAKACVRWLQREPPEIEEARQTISRIVNDLNRVGGIIDRNRSLYRGGTPRRELIDLNEIIHEMAVLLRDAANRQSILIRIDLDAALPMTTADRVQLQQVLMNLMLNSIEAMQGEPGELSVTSQRTEDGQLLISVSDSGFGLPGEDPERIFAAFFTTKPQGTGMGLSVSRRIIEFAWRPNVGECQHRTRRDLSVHATPTGSRARPLTVFKPAGDTQRSCVRCWPMRRASFQKRCLV